MRFKFFLFAVFISLRVVSQTCIDSLKGSADYDAVIGFHDGAGTANNNYGTLAYSAAYLIPGVAQPGGYNGNRSLLHFDLSSIPASATITSAYLNMYAYHPLGTLPGHKQTGNNDFCFRRITSAWTESTVTWSTQPSVTTANQVTVTGTNTYSLDYLNMNVTNLIKDIHASGSNHGFLFRLINETVDNAISFCSEDHTTSSKRPYLRVYYACSSVSLNELKYEDAVKLFPNPAKSLINIVSDKEVIQEMVEIYDIAGKLVLSAQNAGTIDVSDLQPGVYMAQVRLGNTFLRKKLIITN